MKTISYAGLALLVVAAAACSSTTEKTPDTGNGTSGTPAPAPTDPAPADPTPAAPAAVVVKAPKVDEVAKMAGALHVMWTNAEAACDAIEGERQAKMSDGTIMEKYKVAFTVPGEADNKHDTTATDAMTYTYRLRCKKGTTYSAYSNELSGNPK